MKRPYVMSARAEESRRTGEKILDVALGRFAVADFDQVTLDAIASDAGVTVQTVIRRFGSKEGLVQALAEIVGPQVEAQRGEAPVGDVEAAIANLVEHYEVEGDLALHLLRQELRVPAFAEVTAVGKQLHADWVGRVFAPWLRGRRGVARDRLLAQLIAVCDVYVWHLLRRQRGLSQRQTHNALVELVEGVLP